MLSDPRLTSPAPEILAHLINRGHDTIQGIQWGVLPICIGNLSTKIAETVEELVELGFLEEKPSSDGKIFYQASPRYLSTLQQQPTPSSTPTETE